MGQWATYGYADKKREAQRISASKAVEEASTSSTKIDQKKRKNTTKNEAWSDQKTKKVEREKRKEKKEKKKAWQKANQATAIAQSTQTHVKRKQVSGNSDSEDDWEELAREERMAKKVKKGEVDSKVFDEEFTGL